MLRGMERTAIVIAAGPGIGAAVARRFAKEGLPIGLISRNRHNLDVVVETLKDFDVPTLTVAADASDESSLRSALDTATAQLGPPAAVVYNAAVIHQDTPEELSLDEHLARWAVNVGGALVAAAHTLPAMAERGAGSFIITGGMPRPDPHYTSLSLGKSGVRALVSLLDKYYGPSGVHVATVTITGAVAPGTSYDPDDIAEDYWQLHEQPRDRWQHERVH
jgi:NAD(P)-dependent dehydrogenase (short-subunit alcohol dehydrogenase family)